MADFLPIHANLSKIGAQTAGPAVSSDQLTITGDGSSSALTAIGYGSIEGVSPSPTGAWARVGPPPDGGTRLPGSVIVLGGTDLLNRQVIVPASTLPPAVIGLALDSPSVGQIGKFISGGILQLATAADWNQIIDSAKIGLQPGFFYFLSDINPGHILIGDIGGDLPVTPGNWTVRIGQGLDSRTMLVQIGDPVLRA